jgi:hypothetical protein
MFFTETNISFNAVGTFSEESGRLALERSVTEVALVPHETPGEVFPLTVVSVRNLGTFEELETGLWSFEPLGTQEGTSRYRLVYDGARFSNNLERASFAEKDTLHQSFLFGGKIEITVTDGRDRATHLILDLAYGQAVQV